MRSSRLDLPAVLKRWGELVGDVRPELSEIIQPGMQLNDPGDLPFTLSIPFHVDVNIGAGGAGNYSGFSIHPRDTQRGLRSWVEVEEIHLLGGTARQFAARVNTGADVSLASESTPVPRRARGGADAWGFGDWIFFVGWSGAAPSGPFYRAEVGAPTVRQRFAISQRGPSEFGCFNLIMDTANLAVRYTVSGKLHLLEAR